MRLGRTLRALPGISQARFRDDKAVLRTSQ